MIMLKDRKMTVVGRLEGLIQPEDLINQLNFIMEANQTYLMSERLERGARTHTHTHTHTHTRMNRFYISFFSMPSAILMLHKRPY